MARYHPRSNELRIIIGIDRANMSNSEAGDRTDRIEPCNPPRRPAGLSYAAGFDVTHIVPSQSHADEHVRQVGRELFVFGVAQRQSMKVTGARSKAASSRVIRILVVSMVLSNVLRKEGSQYGADFASA